MDAALRSKYAIKGCVQLMSKSIQQRLIARLAPRGFFPVSFRDDLETEPYTEQRRGTCISNRGPTAQSELLFTL